MQENRFLYRKTVSWQKAKQKYCGISAEPVPQDYTPFHTRDCRDILAANGI